jgi:hypothetical protein
MSGFEVPAGTPRINQPTYGLGEAISSETSCEANQGHRRSSTRCAAKATFDDRV